MKNLLNQFLKFSIFAVLGCCVVSCNDNDDPEPNIPLEEKMWLEITTTENNQTIKLPLSGTVNCKIDWNGFERDTETVSESYPMHTYDRAGKYLVTISGTVTALKSSELTEKERSYISGVYNWGKTGLTRMHNAFQGCTNLTHIASDDNGAFADVIEFYNAFSGCSGLTEIPAGLFKSATQVQYFSYTFSDCSNLTEIPADLFDSATQTQDFSGVFSGCSNLTEIPTRLFKNAIYARYFNNVFLGCSNLTEIPTGLFDNNIQAGRFGGAFAGCESLTEIPASLFDNCMQAYDFKATFMDCKNLKAIPAGLFDNLPWADNFMQTFQSCESLTEIPAGLFDKSIRAETFYWTFAGCKNLTGESSYTMVDGQKAHLYERDGDIGGFPEPNGYGCFTGCKGLSDFTNMPENWNHDRMPVTL